VELYSRQIILREVGGIGQRKLLAARCLVYGSGAAAEMALSYLVGAGIGAIDLMLADPVPRALPLAALDTRGPDTTLRTIAGGAAATLDQLDVALIFRGCDSEL